MTTTAKIAECRDVPADAPRAIPEVLEQRPSVHVPHITMRLEHIPEGWAVAGSMMRWDAECWRVSFDHDGAVHGRRFKTEADARAYFDKATG